MWISKSFVNLFTSSRDELIKLRTERDNFRDELSRANILNDWMRIQVNTLQMERSQLVEKVYGVRIPTPMLEKTPIIRNENHSQPDFSFEDIGDQLAKTLGLPTYDS